MIHQVEAQILILLAIAAAVAIASRRFRVPYTLALVCAGLVLGFVELPALAGISLNADLLLLILLPPLLFEAAFHIKWKDFRQDAAVTLTLAVPGVLVAVGATAGLTYLGLRESGLEPRFEWAHAFVFASVIAATDPISVLALFKELGVTKRLYMLVEGESLLNDGVAVVVFVIVLAVIGIERGGVPAPDLNGAGDIVSYGLITFVRMAVGGAAIGLAVGAIASYITRHLDDPLIEITLTTLVAFGSFLLAEEIHMSGVLSTVCAGLVMGSYGATRGMSAVTKTAVEDFWEYMAFLANSFIFLLVGLRLEPEELALDFGAAVIGFVALLIARTVVVYISIPIVNRFIAHPVISSWRIVLVWGGLRGSLSMVLILTLPEDFPAKDLLVNITFGVVALSLFLQGLTMAPLMRKLGLLGQRDARTGYGRARAHVRSAIRALDALEHLDSEGLVDRPAHRRIKAWYEHRLKIARSDAAEQAGQSELDENLLESLQHLIAVERQAIRNALHSGLIGATVAAELEADLIARTVRLDDASQEGEESLRADLDMLLDTVSGEDVDKSAP